MGRPAMVFARAGRGGRAAWPQERRLGLVVALVMAGNLAAALLTKVPLAGHGPVKGPIYWYSDIWELFVLRHLAAHVVPYLHGGYVTSATGSVFLTRGEVEYPVLTGLFMWLASLPVSSPGAYLLVSAALLAPFGIAGAWLLAKMSGHRALLFAAAPAVALYGFINWDLISVALVVGGVYLWWRRRPYLAAAVFALGGCVKLWPAFLLVPLALDLAAGGQWRKGIRAGLIGLGVGLVVNLPFALLNWRGWYAPFAFQAALGLDPRQGMSLWDWYAPGLAPRVAEALAQVAMLGALAVVSKLGWRRASREGAFPFVQLCAAVPFLYILTAKDNSAQYVLWALPFFALLRLRPALWGLWAVVGLGWYTREVFGLSEVGFALFTMVEAVACAWCLVSVLGAEGVLSTGRRGVRPSSAGPGPAEGFRLGAWPPQIEVARSSEAAPEPWGLGKGAAWRLPALAVFSGANKRCRGGQGL
jgi:hypothetical protein